MSAMNFADLFGGGAGTLSEADVQRMVRNGIQRDKDTQTQIKTQEDMHAALARLTNRRLGARSAVTHHEAEGEPGKKISLPTPMTEAEGAKVLSREAEAKEKRTDFSRRFPYAFYDGLVATYRVLQLFYGTTGSGMKQYGFFGEEYDPDRISITTGVTPVRHKDGSTTYKTNEELVPSSRFEFPVLDAQIDFNQWQNAHGVPCFVLTVNAEVRWEQSVEGLFDLVEAYLENHSIYKGQMLEYSHGELRHTWMASNPAIVYSDDVQRRFTHTVWGRIKFHDVLQELDRRTDFRAILYGPIGCGKSEGLNTTAELAHEAGWTVIKMPIESEDALESFSTIFGLADTYGPTVILFEDIDRLFPLDKNQLSKFQNMLDGLNKSTRVSVLMTTNHLEKIHHSMTRPPRVSSLIKIDYLDKGAVEHLMRTLLGDRLSPDVEFEKVWEVLATYPPSFVASAFNDADDIRIIRNCAEGTQRLTLDTTDLVESALLLRAQYEAHNEAVQASETKADDHAALALQQTVMNLLGVPEIRTEVRAAVLGTKK